MKILMVTPYLPYPAASGGQIRTLNLLKYLCNENEITLVALYKSENQKKHSEYLKKYCKHIYLCKRPESPWQPSLIFKSIFSLKPFLVVRNFSDEAAEVIAKLLNKEKFDVIHSETFYVMPHIPETNVPILLVEQTIEFKVYQHFVKSLPIFVKPFFYFDIIKLNYWERHYWKKASQVATVSITDEKVIKNIEPQIKPVIIPNGAGDDMFAPALPAKSLKNPIFLFMGNFTWLQNVEAVEFLIKEVYPLMLKSVPPFKLVIAGQEAKRLNMTSTDTLEIHDIEPDDQKSVHDYYMSSTVFIAPIYGPGGTRLKILAAMAAGLPVIATETGFEGLNVSNGEHVLYANTAPEFLTAIKKILGDKQLFNHLQKNAYNKAKESYSWSSISQRLENVYKTMQIK